LLEGLVERFGLLGLVPLDVAEVHVHVVGLQALEARLARPNDLLRLVVDWGSRSPSRWCPLRPPFVETTTLSRLPLMTFGTRARYACAVDVGGVDEGDPKL
jgi:hypothetical protein